MTARATLNGGSFCESERHMTRRRLLAVSLAVGCVGFAGLAFMARSGCLSLLAPGSRPYHPVSEREAAVFARATRELHPDDVRGNPGRYGKTLVAWAGVLRSYEVSKESDATVLRFDIEHRYFDWIEDIGLQRARYFLSPRGEGPFRAAWSMPIEAFESVSKQVHHGDMLVVYGYPAEVQGQIVGIFPAEYVRLIPAEGYTDRKLNYGRPEATRSRDLP
ncbi:MULTISPECIES: hypothetical protein [Sorangium]|uniref:Uncharacterized protein n=1 Tax=Sorangium cellulosum TaxID=56 RepID=A0A4P2QPG5_SORCE|nr:MULTISPECIES: hypothetical protein [Sorangium]AUX31828.1 uncharacterized protein SOCE836_039610 [Sorangium cellulosum]WCQ91203.1 hypothetical protein NQZ70_03918 [Sorangium sp. Soce836]